MVRQGGAGTGQLGGGVLGRARLRSWVVAPGSFWKSPSQAAFTEAESWGGAENGVGGTLDPSSIESGAARTGLTSLLSSVVTPPF